MNNDHAGTAVGDNRHPSFAWTAASCLKPAALRDKPAFEAAMANPRYPRASAYCPEWVFRNAMGPNPLWLAEHLAATMPLKPGMRVLDLGCGGAITAIYLARECGVEVWAADLWIDPSDNHTRIAAAGLDGSVHAIHAEARRLPFGHGFFDAIVSIDAYHYFGTDVRYLDYIAQFLRPDGQIGIVVPGNAVDPDDPAAIALEPEVAAALGADWYTFRSAEWWRRHWSRSHCVKVDHAAMIADGRDLWERHLAAPVAYYGEHAQTELDAKMLASPAGASLGFCTVVARQRADTAPLVFGIGELTSRIA